MNSLDFQMLCEIIIVNCQLGEITGMTITDCIRDTRARKNFIWDLLATLFSMRAKIFTLLLIRQFGKHTQILHVEVRLEETAYDDI